MYGFWVQFFSQTGSILFFLSEMQELPTLFEEVLLKKFSRPGSVCYLVCHMTMTHTAS